MRNRRKKRCSIACIGLLLSLFAGFSYMGNAAAQSLSEAQEEKEQLEQELEEAQKLIDSLKDSKEDMESAVRQLDQKLTEISEDITKLETQLTEKQTEIVITEEELKEAEADRQKQYEDMKLRIKFMYENSSSTYVEMLFSSKNISEFLNNAEYIAQISQYDRNMLVKYEETVDGIAHMEEQLAAELAELEEMKEQVQKEKDTVSALLAAKEEKLTQTEGELEDAQQIAVAYEAEIQAQNEIIAQIQQAEEERRRQEEEERRRQEEERRRQEEEERLRQEEENNQTTDGEDTEESSENNDQGGGTTEEPEAPEEPETPTATAFTWPCPSSTRITSDYGPRTSPTAGASSYHRGIDIGASYGADIVAAADGTVIFAGYSSSAGNYITVSHGGGLYTVYMHCSSLIASNGQSVSRGQVIAKVGSTGISTGNHLHFGVSVNGSYVNPWEYLK